MCARIPGFVRKRNEFGAKTWPPNIPSTFIGQHMSIGASSGQLSLILSNGNLQCHVDVETLNALRTPRYLALNSAPTSLKCDIPFNLLLDNHSSCAATSSSCFSSSALRSRCVTMPITEASSWIVSQGFSSASW